jgi:hypothetical protein
MGASPSCDYDDYYAKDMVKEHYYPKSTVARNYVTKSFCQQEKQTALANCNATPTQSFNSAGQLLFSGKTYTLSSQCNTAPAHSFDQSTGQLLFGDTQFMLSSKCNTETSPSYSFDGAGQLLFSGKTYTLSSQCNTTRGPVAGTRETGGTRGQVATSAPSCELELPSQTFYVNVESSTCDKMNKQLNFEQNIRTATTAEIERLKGIVKNLNDQKSSLEQKVNECNEELASCGSTAVTTPNTGGGSSGGTPSSSTGGGGGLLGGNASNTSTPSTTKIYKHGKSQNQSYDSYINAQCKSKCDTVMNTTCVKGTHYTYKIVGDYGICDIQRPQGRGGLFGSGTASNTPSTNEFYCFARHENYHGSNLIQFGKYVGDAMTREKCKADCVKDNEIKLGNYPPNAAGPLPTAKDVDCQTGRYPSSSDFTGVNKYVKQSCDDWRLVGNPMTGVDYAATCPGKTKEECKGSINENTVVHYNNYKSAEICRQTGGHFKGGSTPRGEPTKQASGVCCTGPTGTCLTYFQMGGKCDNEGESSKPSSPTPASKDIMFNQIKSGEFGDVLKARLSQECKYDIFGATNTGITSCDKFCCDPDYTGIGGGGSDINTQIQKTQIVAGIEYCPADKNCCLNLFGGKPDQQNCPLGIQAEYDNEHDGICPNGVAACGVKTLDLHEQIEHTQTVGSGFFATKHCPSTAKCCKAFLGGVDTKNCPLGIQPPHNRPFPEFCKNDTCGNAGGLFR